MALAYITLNFKQYWIAATRSEPRVEKRQRINVTIGGATVSQTFDFIDYCWNFDLWTYAETTDFSFGTLDDLRVAYLLPYVNFIDQYSVDQGDVFIEGEFSELAAGRVREGEGAVFKIPTILRKRQV